MLSDGEIGFIVELGDRAMKIQELQQQIKDKDQRIAELEEENEKLKELLDDPHDVWVENNTLTEINNWQNGEINRLQEQLKNAIVPKFYIGQKAYRIWDAEIIFGGYEEEHQPNLVVMEFNIKNLKYVGGKFFYDDGVWELSEEEIFATEADAQKYLEGKNDNIWRGTFLR